MPGAVEKFVRQSNQRPWWARMLPAGRPVSQAGALPPGVRPGRLSRYFQANHDTGLPASLAQPLDEMEKAVAAELGDLKTFLATHGQTVEQYLQARIAKGDRPEGYNPNELQAYLAQAGFQVKPTGKRGKAKTEPALTPGPALTPDRFHAYEQWAHKDYLSAVAQTAHKAQEMGLKPQGLRRLTRRANWRDAGMTFMQGYFSNMTAYGVVGAVGLMLVFILAGPLGLLTAAAIGLGVTVAGAFTWSCIALQATGECKKLSEQARADGLPRGRYIKVAEPTLLRQALATELGSDLLGRTGPRAALDWSLRAVKLGLAIGDVSTKAVSAVGTALGPAAWALGPPSNAAMQVLSVAFKKRLCGASAGPLLGINLSKDGKIESRTDHFEHQVGRLSQNTLVSAGKAAAALASAYGEKFPSAFCEKAAKWPNREQMLEAIFGGNTGGPAAAAFIDVVPQALGVSSGVATAATGFGGGVVSRAALPTNVLTRGAVHNTAGHFSKYLTGGDGSHGKPGKHGGKRVHHHGY